MAVKKHELVHDNCNQLDLNALEQYVQLMNEQPGYLPPPHELIKNCQDILKCLARVSGNEEQLWSLMQSIEEFLLRAVNTGHTAVRHEIVTAILHKFYSFISDPQSDACPATSVVLSVLDTTNIEATLSAARWLVQQGDNGPAGAGLRASLSCLYSWLYGWHGTPALGDWVMAFIKALEENDRHDILIEVSVDNLGRLFLALEDPVTLRQSVADVIFHVMASLRESTEAFDRISPHVGRVLTNLASDSGQWSRHLLQNVVDILTTTVEGLVESLKGEAQEMFKDKYYDVLLCLERHMASRECRFLQMAPWRARNVCLASINARAPMRKVGLLNLGNTCYMNSVLQVLLVTKQFSSHVILNMSAVPYWSKIGVLFSKMMHSSTTKLSPNEVFAVVRPPFFSRNKQHDSSEFLGYLFELLQSYEHHSDVNYDYSRPPVLASSNRLSMISHVKSAQSSSEFDNMEPYLGRRSVSPRSDASVSWPSGSGTRPGGSNSRPSASSSRPTASCSRTSAIGSRPSGSGSRPSGSGMRSSGINTRSSASGSGTSVAGSSTSGHKRSSPDKDGGQGKKRVRLAESAYLRRDSYIDSLFGGVLLTRVKCSECHGSSLSRDVFRDLQLAFPDKPDGWQHSVQSLLDYYCSREVLTGDNQYQCHDCGGLRDAERGVIVEATPKYLILVLKNFKFDSKLQVQTKLMHSMYHNHAITLPAVRSQAVHSRYRLYAAIIHAGTTLDSGHYYALAKDNDQWHMYNDDVVTPTDESQVNNLSRSSTPYILFYRRTDIEEGTTPSLKELPPKIQESMMAQNKHYVDNARKARVTRP